MEDIGHTRTKARSPQTNGIYERLNRTIQDEFYSIAFRKKFYNSLEDIQKYLDEWIDYYNRDRTHTGKYCFGRTPLQTFGETVPLAKEKHWTSYRQLPKILTQLSVQIGTITTNKTLR